MWKRKLLLAALATASVGIMPLPASAEVGIYVDVAPPAPRYEVVPAPRVGYIWQPGVWVWSDGRHHWVRGHWVRERHGMYWHPNRWTESNGHYILDRGHWDKQRYAANGDRDHDGISNRNDRDRDGDGVPNRYDRAPDNPYRQ